MTHHITRRAFLRGIGAVVALPALESLAASSGAFPVRMAHLYMANGVHPEMWTPKGTGREFELSPTLSPLAEMKNDIVVLSELWNAASNTGDGHYVKTSGYLTSTTITRTTGEALNSNGISMDQLAARKVGILTPLPSLELGLERPATGVDTNVGYTQLYGAHIAWNQPTIPLSKEINPREAFDRMFRTFRDSIIVLSYSSNGFPDRDELETLLRRYKGSVTAFEKPHRYHFGTHCTAPLT